MKTHIDNIVLSFVCTNCEEFENKKPYEVPVLFLVNNGIPICEFCGDDCSILAEAEIKEELNGGSV